jgi:hypothetical protein
VGRRPGGRAGPDRPALTVLVDQHLDAVEDAVQPELEIVVGAVLVLLVQVERGQHQPVGWIQA